VARHPRAAASGPLLAALRRAHLSYVVVAQTGHYRTGFKRRSVVAVRYATRDAQPN
jgi:hypothetical protein